jgi:hypothetical protein
MVMSRRPGKLFQNMIGPLFIGLKIRLEIVWKKKQLENSKHNQKLDQDDLPQGPANGHGHKSVPVKIVNTG